MARPAFTDSENDEVRRLLTAGALALFREQGVANLTLRKVGELVGVSHTKLYRYFENKEALLATVRMASLTILYGMLVENDRADADPMERMRLAGRTLLKFAVENPRDYHFLFSASQFELEADQALISLRHTVFNYVVKLAEQASREGLISSDPRTLANLAWASLHGIITLNQNNQLLEGRYLEDLVEQALEMLFGPDKAGANVEPAVSRQ